LASDPGETPDLQALRRAARLSLFNRIERVVTPTPKVEVDPAATLQAAEEERQRLRQRYNVTPRLVGSLPLRLSAPGDTDIDFFVPIHSPDKFKSIASRLEHSSEFEASKYNKPGAGFHVFTRKTDTPIDVAIAYGDPAKRFAAVTKQRQQLANAIPEDLRQQIIQKRILLKNTPFDDSRGHRYKAWKRELASAMGDPYESYKLQRDPVPELQTEKLGLDKLATVLNLTDPQVLKNFSQFTARPDVYGHRTRAIETILNRGRVESALEALRRGTLQSYEKGHTAATHTAPQIGTMTEEQLDQFGDAMLRDAPDIEAARTVAGDNWTAAMSQFLQKRHNRVRGFLHSMPEDTAEEFRSKHLSIPKLSPYIFLTKGLVDDPKYGDVGLFLQSRTATPSPFMNFINTEHVVGPRHPAEERALNARTGYVVGPRTRIAELEAAHPDYNYVSEEDIPTELKSKVFIPTHSVGEIARRWIPNAASGRIRLHPR
jgi:hypothetical protein